MQVARVRAKGDAMKVCIYGVGAIGGLVGARLAAAGNEVGAIARGATLAALRERGVVLRSGTETVRAPLAATDDPRSLGPQDLVIVAVKGPALPSVAQSIGPLLGAHTMVLTAMNGVPWWFFSGRDGPCADMQLESVDPGGSIGAAISARHVIGCVVHASASVAEPGVIVHTIGRGLIIGEPAGPRSERLARAAALLTHAGFNVTQSENIHYDIWYKLWGNLTMNPIAALTGATGDRVIADPLLREFCSAAMREAAAVGARVGCAVTQAPDDRHAITRELGAFRPSMLQDAEAGRPLEIDAIVGAVKEIGARVGVATPNIDALLGLIRLFGRVRGLYPEGLSV
jgi:2-dehydropantoate 2-reductase